MTIIRKQDIRRALEAPADYTYNGQNPEMFKTWAIGPVVTNRDATAEEKAMMKKLIDFLESDPTLDRDWHLEDCSHWAVGWVIHLTYRVVEPSGRPTRIFRIIKHWYEKMLTSR